MLSGACLLHDPSDRVNPPSELIDRAMSDPSQSITSPVTELEQGRGRRRLGGRAAPATTPAAMRNRITGIPESCQPECPGES